MSLTPKALYYSIVYDRGIAAHRWSNKGDYMAF